MQLRCRLAADDSHLPTNLPRCYVVCTRCVAVQGEQELERSIKGMLPWRQLSGIDTAVGILKQALVDCRSIMVVG